MGLGKKNGRAALRMNCLLMTVACVVCVGICIALTEVVSAWSSGLTKTHSGREVMRTMFPGGFVWGCPPMLLLLKA